MAALDWECAQREVASLESRLWVVKQKMMNDAHFKAELIKKVAASKIEIANEEEEMEMKLARAEEAIAVLNETPEEERLLTIEDLQMYMKEIREDTEVRLSHKRQYNAYLEENCARLEEHMKKKKELLEDELDQAKRKAEEMNPVNRWPREGEVSPIISFAPQMCYKCLKVVEGEDCCWFYGPCCMKCFLAEMKKRGVLDDPSHDPSEDKKCCKCSVDFSTLHDIHFVLFGRSYCRACHAVALTYSQ